MKQYGPHVAVKQIYESSGRVSYSVLADRGHGLREVRVYSGPFAYALADALARRTSGQLDNPEADPVAG